MYHNFIDCIFFSSFLVSFGPKASRDVGGPVAADTGFVIKVVSTSVLRRIADSSQGTQ